MGWEVVRRKIGRAGSPRQRAVRQRGWNLKYGEGNWETGYVVGGDFVSQEAAWETIYLASYTAHFHSHPEDLRELITTAKTLSNPHAEATGGVDLQLPAIRHYLREHNLQLQGTEVVDIGTWQGEYSHALSVRLSPLHIACAIQPRLTLEKFWQSKKCLAIWEE